MYNAAILTISDKGHAGLRTDESGMAIREILENKGYNISYYAVLPDERDQISAALRKLADNRTAELVLTTGGTGFSLRDVTPEATLDVAERLCPGIAEAMRAMSMAKTKRAMLSRAVVVLRGQTLIVNLPGSQKAVRECLDCVIDQVEHGLDILTGRDAECGAPH